jgi:hypothetical protein
MFLESVRKLERQIIAVVQSTYTNNSQTSKQISPESILRPKRYLICPKSHTSIKNLK